MESIRSKDVVTTFRSCSVRPRHWVLVNSLVHRVLTPHGFRRFTIGRNISLAEQSDDAVRRLMDSCECLIGVATERLNATDRDFPDRTLSLATPYLLQETAMAHQVHLIFKVTGMHCLASPTVISGSRSNLNSTPTAASRFMATRNDCCPHLATSSRRLFREEPKVMRIA